MTIIAIIWTFDSLFLYLMNFIPFRFPYILNLFHLNGSYILDIAGSVDQLYSICEFIV